MNWNPIETAPKDRPLLLWGPMWKRPYIGRSIGEKGLVCIEHYDGEGYATHWMEMPETPSVPIPQPSTVSERMVAGI